MIKLLTLHLQDLAAADQRPSSNITNNLLKLNPHQIYGRSMLEVSQGIQQILCIPSACMQSAFPRHIFHYVFVLPVPPKKKNKHHFSLHNGQQGTMSYQLTENILHCLPLQKNLQDVSLIG